MLKDLSIEAFQLRKFLRGGSSVVDRLKCVPSTLVNSSEALPLPKSYQCIYMYACTSIYIYENYMYVYVYTLVCIYI